MNPGAPAWRTLIVDDEPLAREGIRTRLTTLGGFDIVGECNGGRAAVAAIRTQAPDVVFLDVQMPIVDGFGVIDQIGVDTMPAIVFVSAHNHYALRAFDAQAIDYVLKPVDDARFTRAVDGVRRRLTQARDSSVAQQLTRLLAEVGQRGSTSHNALVQPDRLVAHDRDRIEMIPFDEIDWIEADDDYVRVHTGSRQLLLRLTMNGLERTLPKARHVRIHRSTIVNITRIRTLRPLPNAEYTVVLTSGVVLRASRSYADRLRSALGIT